MNVVEALLSGFTSGVTFTIDPSGGRKRCRLVVSFPKVTVPIRNSYPENSDPQPYQSRHQVPACTSWGLIGIYLVDDRRWSIMDDAGADAISISWDYKPIALWEWLSYSCCRSGDRRLKEYLGQRAMHDIAERVARRIEVLAAYEEIVVDRGIKDKLADLKASHPDPRPEMIQNWRAVAADRRAAKDAVAAARRRKRRAPIKIGKP